MQKRKNLVKPKPKTLKRAENELKSKKIKKAVKTPAGYVLRNAKGVKVKKKGSI